MLRTFNHALLLVVLAQPGVPARPLSSQPPPDTVGRDVMVPTPWILGVGPALAASLIPLDGRFRDGFQSESLQASGFAGGVADTFRQLGEPFVLGLTGGVALTAWAAGDVQTRDAMVHVLESLAATGILVAGMKTLAGRARPSELPEPWEYALGRGARGHEFRSFPSGHTAQAFTLAASLSAELEQHRGWGAAWVAPTLYGAAALTGLSRVYDDRHWLSDTVMGAFVGSLATRLVRRLNHD